MSAGTSAASARDPVAGEMAEAEGGAGGGSGALARWGGVLWVGGVSLATALLRAAAPRWHLANLSMLYLLVILATALLAGRGPAILAALLSFMALDWYFDPPVGHWTVSDPDEWLTLLIFLMTGMVTGQWVAALCLGPPPAGCRGAPCRAQA